LSPRGNGATSKSRLTQYGEVVYRAERIDQRNVRHPSPNLAVVLMSNCLNGCQVSCGGMITIAVE
jgi:hypothetical protein